MLNKIGPKRLTQKLTNGVITAQKWGHIEIVSSSGGRSTHDHQSLKAYIYKYLLLYISIDKTSI